MLKHKKWQPIANILLVVTVGWGGFQLMGLSTEQIDKPQVPTNDCQLSTQPCKQHNASVALSNDVIRPMQSTEISVSWPELPTEADNLILSLEGHEMMMGVYQLKLARTADGLFSGNLMLPFCTSNEMTWQGNIKPLSDSGQITPLNISLRMIK